MCHVRRPTALSVVLAVVAGVGLGSAARADFTVNGSFGPNGDVGFANSPPNLAINFGATGNGTISQLDGFINVAGQDYSTNGFGTSRQLTDGPPVGLAYTFGASQPTAHQLLLTYHFVNNTGTDLPSFKFLSFVDADIGPNFTDETATVAGSPGSGPPGRTPTEFQAGDPTSSTIFTNLSFGHLDNTNTVPPGAPGDVSMALGLTAGLVPAGAAVEFQVLLSDDGTALPGLRLTQNDPVFTGDALTYSATVSILPPVPEPSSLVLVGLGLCGVLAFARRRSGA